MEKTLKDKVKLIHITDSKLFLENFLTTKYCDKIKFSEANEQVFDAAFLLFQSQYCTYNENTDFIETIPDNISKEQILSLIRDEKNLVSLYPFYDTSCVKKLKKVNHFFLQSVDAANYYYNTLIDVCTFSLNAKTTKEQETQLIEDFSNAVDAKNDLNDYVEKAQAVFVYKKRPVREQLKSFITNRSSSNTNDESLTK